MPILETLTVTVTLLVLYCLVRVANIKLIVKSC